MSLHDSISLKPSEFRAEFVTACDSIPFVTQLPKIRDLKKLRKFNPQTPEDLSQGIFSSEAENKNECPRCIEKSNKSASSKNRTWCDVGFKAVFRKIRDRCGKQIELIHDVPKPQLREHLEKVIASQAANFDF
jgi:hypothetical protein